MEQTDDVLEVLKTLPKQSYVYDPVGRQVGIVKRGVRGFYPVSVRIPPGEDGNTFVADLNKRAGTTPEQAEAMHIGSMFGWEVPGANPANHRKPTGAA